VRDAAAKSLAKLGEQVEQALQRVLEKEAPPEVRRRIDAILAAPRAMPSGQRLRTLRAIAALERIGTLEAREVLRKLASGDAPARETREAKESLERLGRRMDALNQQSRDR
jgi:HEAT repeat protein